MVDQVEVSYTKPANRKVTNRQQNLILWCRLFTSFKGHVPTMLSKSGCTLKLDEQVDKDFRLAQAADYDGRVPVRPSDLIRSAADSLSHLILKPTSSEMPIPLMDGLTKQGVGIIMISSELPEVLGMSDRIMVMREGTIVKELSRAEANEETIMKYAVGSVSRVS